MAKVMPGYIMRVRSGGRVCVLLAAIAALSGGVVGCGTNSETSTDPDVEAYLQHAGAGPTERTVNAPAKHPDAHSDESSPTLYAERASKDLDRLGRKYEAQVGATVGPLGAEPLVAGSLQSGSAWSTIKVPIAMAVAAQNGGFSASDQELVSRAITMSDNEAAAELFNELGSLKLATEKVTAILRAAGDENTVVSTQGRGDFSTYGQTDWSLSAQQRFMNSLLLGCSWGADSREYVLDQMRRVTADTWGFGSIGMPALWKGGWGPGIDGRYLLRQMGAFELDGTQYVATLATIPDNGNFDAGRQAADEVAKWIVAQAPTTSGESGC